MMKMSQDNDVIDRKCMVNTKNDIELPWPIEQDVIYDENDTRQWHDQSYKHGPC